MFWGQRANPEHQPDASQAELLVPFNVAGKAFPGAEFPWINRQGLPDRHSLLCQKCPTGTAAGIQRTPLELRVSKEVVRQARETFRYGIWIHKWVAYEVHESMCQLMHNPILDGVTTSK
jgi:hypothetical protein